MINIKTIPTGYLKTNTYIINDENNLCVIVDPGGGFEKIKNYCEEQNLVVKAILLTHGHFDHILAVNKLKLEFSNINIYIHELDEKMLSGEWNLASEMGLSFEPIFGGKTIVDGECIDIGSMSFEVISTPGHTQGSVCYLLNKEYLFSGDTLFYSTYGRTDFYGGSVLDMKSSLKKLFSLNGDFTVYPGHMQQTSLDYERKNNEIFLV